MQDIMLIDKLKGITSARLVDEVKKKLGVKKAGHAGTLDPLATGLMIVGIEGGTKKLVEYLKLPKSYEAQILIGKKTTTGDLEGEVVEEQTVEKLDESKIREILSGMLGTLTLPAPAYSAIKRGGVPLYKKMRRGELVEPPLRSMDIQNAQLRSLSCGGGACIASVLFAVGSGVYIRSLAEELGRRLGYPATLKELCRTKIGSFKLEGAKKLEDL